MVGCWLVDCMRGGCWEVMGLVGAAVAILNDGASLELDR